jgi:hypothetical protein
MSHAQEETRGTSTNFDALPVVPQEVRSASIEEASSKVLCAEVLTASWAGAETPTQL